MEVGRVSCLSTYYVYLSATRISVQSKFSKKSILVSVAFHCFSLSLSHSPPLAFPPSLSSLLPFSLSNTHTHTHTHSLSLSLPPSPLLPLFPPSLPPTLTPTVQGVWKGFQCALQSPDAHPDHSQPASEVQVPHVWLQGGLSHSAKTQWPPPQSPQEGLEDYVSFNVSLSLSPSVCVLCVCVYV